MRSVLDVIARDEALHAELGWDLVAHGLALDPSLAAPLLEATDGLARRADTALERAQAAEVGERLGRLVGSAR